MNHNPFKLLYVYKERVPVNLQQLVLDSIPASEFVVSRMTYTMPDEEKCEKMRWADGVLFAPGRYLPEIVFCSATDA